MTLTLDSRTPAGPLEQKWSQRKAELTLVSPGQQAALHRDRGRHRPRRRVGRRLALRARLQGEGVLLPGLGAPRPLDRRAGRHQRGEELPERRRQRLSPVLRDDQGRRLPRPRGQRLPPRRGERRRSSTSASPRACRSPASTAARSPTARSAAPWCRAPSTPAARPGSSSCSAPTPRSPRQVAAGGVELHPRTEMLDLVVVDGRARGIVTRDLVTGEVAAHAGDAVLLCTGGYANVFFLSTNAKGCNVTAIWRAHKRGAGFANPCYTQIHPTCIPQGGDYQSKLTLMSESLRNDGRVWVPKRAGDGRAAGRHPRGRARLLPRAHLPELRQPGAARRVVARRQAHVRRGARRRPGRARRLPRLRRLDRPARRADDPRALRQPVRDVRADHRRGPLRGADAHLPGAALHDGRAVGRLRPDEHDPRPVRARRGELLRPRRQPPRRQRPHAGAGGRLLRDPVHGRRLPRRRPARAGRRRITRRSARRSPASRRGPRRCSRSRASRTVDSFHRELGRILWEHCGMARTEAGLRAGDRRDPGARRRVLPRSQGPRRRRGPQPGAREGRARRRLLRARRADVPRRARARASRAAATSARSSRPPTARRCATTTSSATSPSGSTSPAASRSATSSRSRSRA